MFTKQEQKIIRQIRKTLGDHSRPYMFWIAGNTWEGGFELSLDFHFRNQYTIPAKGKRVIKNW